MQENGFFFCIYLSAMNKRVQHHAGSQDCHPSKYQAVLKAIELVCSNRILLINLDNSRPIDNTCAEKLFSLDSNQVYLYSRLLTNQGSFIHKTVITSIGSLKMPNPSTHSTISLTIKDQTHWFLWAFTPAPKVSDNCKTEQHLNFTLNVSEASTPKIYCN